MHATLRAVGRILLAVVVAIALVVGAAAAESSSIAPLQSLSSVIMQPGGFVLSRSHYGAPVGFQWLSGSDGPFAAYLWTLFVSCLFWAAMIGLVWFAVRRWLAPANDLTRRCS